MRQRDGSSVSLSHCLAFFQYILSGIKISGYNKILNKEHNLLEEFCICAAVQSDQNREKIPPLFSDDQGGPQK